MTHRPRFWEFAADFWHMVAKYGVEQPTNPLDPDRNVAILISRLPPDQREFLIVESEPVIDERYGFAEFKFDREELSGVRTLDQLYMLVCKTANVAPDHSAG